MKKIIFDDISSNGLDLTFYESIKPLARPKLSLHMILKLYPNSSNVQFHDNPPL